MSSKVEKILNANIYLDDVNHVGKAEEVEVPKISIATTEHKSLGMIGPLELFGGVEKLELKIKWGAHHKEVLTTFSPTKANKITVRAAQQAYENSSVVATKQVRCVAVGRIKENAPSPLKQNEGTVETTFACDYYKKTVDGVDVCEVDIPNSIFKINGEDCYEDVRSCLGL